MTTEELGEKILEGVQKISFLLKKAKNGLTEKELIAMIDMPLCRSAEEVSYI